MEHPPLTQTRSAQSFVGQRMFGDYVIQKVLGQGGMGSVYLARHTSIDQSVAIKVLHPSSAEDIELVKRFNREAKAIARLSHPNIIRVFLFGHTEDDLVYLVIEYVEGLSLRQLLEREKSIPELRAIYIVKQVLAALCEAHHLGIIHRDLKPDNILLTEYRGNTDFVKVVDFGIAKVQEPEGVAQEKLTQAGVVYGTPEYLSPEQAQAKEVDGRADLYSVGVILWEMVTGVVPFDGPTAMSILIQHVYDPPPDPARFNPSLSEGMIAVLSRAMEKEPDKRYQTADEFLAALVDLERRLRQEQLEKGELLYDSSTKTEVWLPSLVGRTSNRYLQIEQGNNRKTIIESGGGSAPPLRKTRRTGKAIVRQAIVSAIVVGLLLLVAIVIALAYLITQG
ncbi:MAG: serine/threonine protein kinase [Bradymonadales bacterium]|nr:serine/threonine protein kinase [Bradymonadales bacterium]